MEVLADAMRKNRSSFIQELHNIRYLDSGTVQDLEKLKTEENELTTYLATAVKNGETVDEQALVARCQLIVDKRNACIQRYEEQMSIAQVLYDQLDGQINYLSKPLPLLLLPPVCPVCCLPVCLVPVPAVRCAVSLVPIDHVYCCVYCRCEL